MPRVPSKPRVGRNFASAGVSAAVVSQAPVFRRQTEDAARSAAAQAAERTVIPHGVFVARRSAFHCTVRGGEAAGEVLGMIFGALPLEEHGWRKASTTLTFAGYSWGEAFYLVSRA